MISRRVLGMRILDISLSILILYLLFSMILYHIGKKSLGYSLKVGLVLAIVTMFPLAIFFHAIFNVPTSLNCRLGLGSKDRCKMLMEKVQGVK